jgi:hypothetical protein
MTMLEPALNRSYVVDIVVLCDLVKLVRRAIERRDGSELREFIESREEAYGRLRDAKPVRLEPEKLVTALADIGALERSVIAREPKSRELLQAARMIGTHERDVCKRAFERLGPRAARLRRLVELQAPETILTNEVSMVSEALGALDHFDFSARWRADSEPLVWGDEELVRFALSRCYVPECEDDEMGLGVGRPFVRNRELFPRPNEPELIPGWERFCGSMPYISPPRAVMGASLSETTLCAIAFRQFAEQDLTASPREKERFLWFLGNHIRCLNYAAQHGHAVVEWVEPHEEDESLFVMSNFGPSSWALPGAPRRGDARLEILSRHLGSVQHGQDVPVEASNAVPLGFPSFLEPPRPPARAEPRTDDGETLVFIGQILFMAVVFCLLWFAHLPPAALARVSALRRSVLVATVGEAEVRRHEIARDAAYADALRWQAFHRMQRGDYEIARDKLDQAAALDPEGERTGRIRQARSTIDRFARPREETGAETFRLQGTDRVP